MNWYACYVRPQFERTAEKGLEQEGIESFYPYVMEASKWSDRVKQIERPLFPGYVFARFHRSPQTESTVHRVRGILGLLGDPTGPYPIPESEIEAVRRVLASGLPMQAESFHQFQIGEKVTIKHGPFVGQTGVIMRQKKGARLIVAITALQIARSVEFPADSLKPEPAE